MELTATSISHLTDSQLQETCEVGGWCNDWYLGEGGGCVVPMQPHPKHGHRLSCQELTNPFDNTTYQWADYAGCIAMKVRATAVCASFPNPQK